MKLPDKDLRAQDYGEWLWAVGKALVDELRAEKISYKDAFHALHAGARLAQNEAMLQEMRERHG